LYYLLLLTCQSTRMGVKNNIIDPYKELKYPIQFQRAARRIKAIVEEWEKVK